MQAMGLADAVRREPFYNIGLGGVTAFQDLTVNADRLLLILEKSCGEHLDVVSALTAEVPSYAVEFLDDLLGRSTRWRTSMGWDTEPDEVPIYLCPIDYDLLCGGVVATVERSNTQIRLHQFRHISTNADRDRVLTETFTDLDFTFPRGETDQLLAHTRAAFAEKAKRAKETRRQAQPSHWRLFVLATLGCVAVALFGWWWEARVAPQIDSSDIGHSVGSIATKLGWLGAAVLLAALLAPFSTRTSAGSWSIRLVAVSIGILGVAVTGVTAWLLRHPEHADLLWQSL